VAVWGCRGEGFK